MERGVKRKQFEADLEVRLTDDQDTSFLYILSQKKLVDMSNCMRGYSLQRLLLVAKLTNRLKLKTETPKPAQQVLHVSSSEQITNSISQNISVPTPKPDSLPDISTFMFPMSSCSPFPALISSSTEEDDEVSGYSGLGSTLTELSRDNSCVSPMPFSQPTRPSSPMPTTASQSTGYFINPSHVLSFTSLNRETGDLTSQWLDMSTSDSISTSTVTSEPSSVESMDTTNVTARWPACDDSSSSDWTPQLPVSSMSTANWTDIVLNNEGAGGEGASASSSQSQSKGNLEKKLEELGIFTKSQTENRSG